MTVCAQTRYVYGTRCEAPAPQPTIEDLEREIALLRRRLSDLEHRTNDRQAAHNALATAVEQLACPGPAGEARLP